MPDHSGHGSAPRAENGTYLGFDYGEKNIGVAVGQRITGTASELETIRAGSRQALWTAVERLVQAWQPVGFVVGIPYPHEGVENPIAEPIRKFCRQLEGRYRRPVYMMDETLSTRESQEIFYRERSKRSVRFTEIKDQLAAQLILQTWLSSTSEISSSDVRFT